VVKEFEASEKAALENRNAEIEFAKDTAPQEIKTAKAADGFLYYLNGPQKGERVFDVSPPDEGGDMSESERRIFMFNKQQTSLSPSINMIEERGFDPANIRDKLADGVLGGNFFKTTEGQMYNAAGNAWAESALRLATGAAATPQEYDRIKGMYFAQIGDTPETIEFKRVMRENYENVLGATLEGDIDADLPDPLAYAVEQFYAERDEPEPSSTMDFSAMSRDDILNVNLDTLSPDQYDAYEAALQEAMAE
jgi:hypothetical protein